MQKKNKYFCIKSEKIYSLQTCDMDFCKIQTRKLEPTHPLVFALLENEKIFWKKYCILQEGFVSSENKEKSGPVVKVQSWDLGEKDFCFKLYQSSAVSQKVSIIQDILSNLRHLKRSLYPHLSLLNKWLSFQGCWASSQRELWVYNNVGQFGPKNRFWSLSWTTMFKTLVFKLRKLQSAHL